MEVLNREDFERYLFFETQREQAQRDHAANKDDAQALLRWGGALLELAHFRQGPESMKTLETAVEKFQMSLNLQPEKHEAMWCLGNAYMSQGLLQPDAGKANDCFDKARTQFKKALDREPTNGSYQRTMEMVGKAPEIFAELQLQLQQQAQPAAEIAASSSRGAAASGKKQKGGVSDLWYDLGGWVILAGLITGYVIAVQRTAPPTA